MYDGSFFFWGGGGVVADFTLCSSTGRARVCITTIAIQQMEAGVGGT